MAKDNDPRPAALENLQRKIILAGFTQTALAERLGVRPASVNHWIHGRTLPAPDKFKQLDDLIGLTKPAATAAV